MENPPPEKSAPPPIDLHQAFWWYCEICASENYERATTPPMSDEELEYIRTLHNTTAGHLFYTPRYVTCSDCGEKYTASYDNL